MLKKLRSILYVNDLKCINGCKEPINMIVIRLGKLHFMHLNVPQEFLSSVKISLHCINIVKRAAFNRKNHNTFVLLSVSINQ